MKRKLMAFCTIIVATAVVLTVSGSSFLKNCSEHDVSYAQRSRYYNEADDMNTTMNEAGDMNSTTAKNNVGNFVDNKIEGFSNAGSIIGGLLGGSSGEGETNGGILNGGSGIGSGIGDAIGSIGGIFGGILGGESSESVPNTNVVTYAPDDNAGGYIDPVPAATFTPEENNMPTSAPTQGETSVIVSQVVTVNNVNNNTTANPYQKPAGTINPGDSGEGVKWMQWVFYYTGYGLDEKSITGEYDEKTQELVEKLQKEKGLTVDGVVNDAVIDKIELLYYEYTVTATTSNVAGIITLPETTVTTGEYTTENESDSFWLVVVIVASIWCVAIIIILAVYILKKKKKAQQKQEEAQEQTTEKSENADNSVRSLSDLFEEANK